MPNHESLQGSLQRPISHSIVVYTMIRGLICTSGIRLTSFHIIITYIDDRAIAGINLDIVTGGVIIKGATFTLSRKGKHVAIRSNRHVTGFEWNGNIVNRRFTNSRKCIDGINAGLIKTIIGRDK